MKASNSLCISLVVWCCGAFFLFCSCSHLDLPNIMRNGEIVSAKVTCRMDSCQNQVITDVKKLKQIKTILSQAHQGLVPDVRMNHGFIEIDLAMNNGTVINIYAIEMTGKWVVRCEDDYFLGKDMEKIGELIRE